VKAFRLISRSLNHYRGSHLATAAGIAITTAVICGALIIGSSLRQSLLQIVDMRMGQTTHSLTAGERVFTREYASRLGAIGSMPAAAVLKTEAVTTTPGGELRVNNVQVWGTDSMFEKVTGAQAKQFSAGDGQVLISHNLASRLMVDTGDFIQLRMKHIGPIPANTPFVSEEHQSITRRVKVKGILQKEELGHFNLQTSQSAPYNVFVDLNWLNRVMNLKASANMVLIRTAGMTDKETLKAYSQKAWQVEDGNLKLEHLESSNQWKLSSERVFIENHLSDIIKRQIPEAELVLTYFVNSISKGEKETPYSFVSAVSGTARPIRQGEIVINQWLADDLQLQTGDSLYMTFYEVGPLRELSEKRAGMRVAGIVSMEEAQSDQSLMPLIPGLSDAGNCRDWETGIPIRLESIRQKDEDYWERHKGTPKAYISLHQGQDLWENRFGNLTAILIPAEHYDESQLRRLISSQVDPSLLSFQINNIREKGKEAAIGGVDFSQLFAGLGVFIIFSGLLLTGLLLSYSLKRRQGQIRLFAALGFPKKLIVKIMMAEALAVSFVGAIAGLLLSIAYSRLILSGLNHLWYDIVRTEALSLHFHALPLLAGAFVSFLLGAAVTGSAISKAINQSLGRNEEKRRKPPESKIRTILPFLFTALLILSLFPLILPALSGHDAGVLHWFASGLALLLAVLSGIYYFLYAPGETEHKKVNIRRLAWKNLLRNPNRSFTIIVLLALGSFVIVITAANWKDHLLEPGDKSAGTGGFLFMAESTVPIMRNLNQEDTRLAFGLPEKTYFVQLFSAYDDDASCLNLNRVANPRLLAVDPASLDGRFSFLSSHHWLDENKPWQSLNRSEGNIIPAIADQTVIQWGLGKKVGDTLFYVNAMGEEIRVLLIGGLAPSVFQGNIIVSADNFLRHFPASGGSHVFLIDAPADAQQALAQELSFIFRDYGWEMQETGEKLAGFNSVENTYLRIFFLMGAFGMLLGILGLAIIIAKSLLERSRETAILCAMGFRTGTILNLYVTEYMMLFLAGIFSGSLPAVLAIFPTFTGSQQNVSLTLLLTTMGLLMLNGILWMLVVSFRQIKKQAQIPDLRND
jgi:putative ABC transport system permease protein